MPEAGTAGSVAPSPPLWAVFATLLTTLLLSGPVLASSDPLADTHLARGQLRLAVQRYRQVLDEEPGNARVQLGLGRALAGLGRCEQAVSTLQPLRGGEHWTRRAGVDLGACLIDLGRESEGLEAVEEAAALGGGEAVMVRLGWEALAARDLPRFEHTLSLLQAQHPDSVGALLLAGASAWVDGELDEMSWALQDLRDLQPQAPLADLVEAWAALEAGDPWQARTLLRGQNTLSRLRLPQVATWLVEAERRAGRPHVAQASFAKHLATADGVVTEAVRLRLVVDLEPAAASQGPVDALLARHPLHPEVVATAWYQAHRAGQPTRAAALAERYQRLVPPGRWSLARLLPAPAEDG